MYYDYVFSKPKLFFSILWNKNIDTISTIEWKNKTL